MKGSADAVNFVYNLVKSVGNTFKYTSSGDGERIVVNSLPIVGDILQRCYININAFVPDIENAGTSSLPNTKRLQELERILLDLLEAHQNSGDIHIYIESTAIERNPSLNEHFVNIKLKVNIKNP